MCNRLQFLESGTNIQHKIDEPMTPLKMSPIYNSTFLLDGSIILLKKYTLEIERD